MSDALAQIAREGGDGVHGIVGSQLNHGPVVTEAASRRARRSSRGLAAILPTADAHLSGESPRPGSKLATKAKDSMAPDDTCGESRASGSNCSLAAFEITARSQTTAVKAGKGSIVGTLAIRGSAPSEVPARKRRGRVQKSHDGPYSVGPASLSAQADVVGVHKEPVSQWSFGPDDDTSGPAPGCDVLSSVDSHTRSGIAAPYAEPLAQLVELGRIHTDWMRAKNRLVLQGKAIGRRYCGGDKAEGGALFDAVMDGEPVAAPVQAAMAPIAIAAQAFAANLKDTERAMIRLARQLPAHGIVKDTYGLSELGFAHIVAAAGDVGSYLSPRHLWKRFGLGLVDTGGGLERQRRVGGADALAHGYAPARRSIMWNIGNGLIGCMGRGPRLEPDADPSEADLSPYQVMFVLECRRQASLHPEMARPVTAKGMESFSKHCAARAKRKVEKEFLKALWRRWREEVACAG